MTEYNDSDQDQDREVAPTEEEAEQAAEGRKFELEPEGPGLFEITKAEPREKHWKQWSGHEMNFTLELVSEEEHPPLVWVQVPIYSRDEIAAEVEWPRNMRVGLYKQLEIGPLADYPDWKLDSLVGMIVECDVVHNGGKDRAGKPKTYANVDGFIPFSLPPVGSDVQGTAGRQELIDHGVKAPGQTASAPAGGDDYDDL